MSNYTLGSEFMCFEGCTIPHSPKQLATMKLKQLKEIEKPLYLELKGNYTPFDQADITTKNKRAYLYVIQTEIANRYR